MARPNTQPATPLKVWEAAGTKCGGTATREDRAMARAELLGGHSHQALNGVQVHVCRRGGKYLARGRLDGQAFGETLGDNESKAAARLRQLLTEIENGSYVRPSERRRRRLGGGVPRLTLRQLAGEFLADRRRARGRRTAQDYAARLGPVLDFAEKAANMKRWPLAMEVDSEFARSLRAFLFEHRTTRNGKAGGTPKPLSGRQVVNVLECLRTMLHWARGPQVRKLPADWVSPMTADLIGQPPAKNPLREDKLTLETRVAVIRQMDCWQLCQLALSVVLPLRPDEAAGLLVGDVNFQKGWLEFGERFKDANFTKGKTAFVLPFPDELRPVLLACVDGRAEGPLLRSRKAFGVKARADTVASTEELARLYRDELLRQPQGAVQAEQDRKTVFRSLLRRLGGVAEDALAREFKKLLAGADVAGKATLYSLRHSVTTAMHRAGVPHLELRYLTGHATTDILNVYASLDPVGAMRRYFGTIRPLLDAIAQRADELGLSDV